MRTTVWIAIVVLAMLCLAVCGCPKPVKQAAEAARTAQDAQDGSFTIKNEKGEETKVEAKGEGESGSTTVTGPNGETTKSEYGKDTVSEKDVGIAFYPGAIVEMGSKATASGESGGSFTQVTLTTKDPLDKVASWYKGKYAEGNTVMDNPGNCMIIFGEGEHKGKIITMTEDKEAGLTRIAIAAGS
jgi:hypothetical protein